MVALSASSRVWAATASISAMTSRISAADRVSVLIVSWAVDAWSLAADAAPASPDAEALISVDAVATCSEVERTTVSNSSASRSRALVASVTRPAVACMAPRAALMSAAPLR